MGNFSADDIKSIMPFYLSYYGGSLAGNETTRRLFATGILSEVIKAFETREHKLTLYSDHDDSIVVMATALGFTLPSYPPFASQIAFELWDVNGTEEIRARLNDVDVKVCGDTCDIEGFKALARKVSFYGDPEGY